MAPRAKLGGSAAEDNAEGPTFPEALERSLSTARARLEAKLVRERESAAKHEDQAKSLESQLKALGTGLAIAIDRQPVAVSLLYKKVGSGAYIKGRCWWNGKQREVQIGTILAVLSKFKGPEGKSVPSLDPPPSWNDVKANAKLMAAIKELGREKLRAYIIKQLMNDYLPDYRLPSDDKGESPPIGRQNEAAPHEVPGPGGAGDWYSRWHEDNFVGASVA